MSTHLQQSLGQLLWCSDRRREATRSGLYHAPCSDSGFLPTSMRLSQSVNGARGPPAASTSPHKPIDTENAGFRSQASLSPRLCLPLRNALLDRTPTPPWLIPSIMGGLGSRPLGCGLELSKLKNNHRPRFARPRHTQDDLLIPDFDDKTLFQGRRR
jgi:hypothetical protein